VKVGPGFVGVHPAAKAASMAAATMAGRTIRSGQPCQSSITGNRITSVVPGRSACSTPTVGGSRPLFWPSVSLRGAFHR